MYISLRIYTSLFKVVFSSRDVWVCVSLLPSLAKQLLCWAHFLMCELNYRFLISSKLGASRPLVNSMDILSQMKKVNKTTIAKGPNRKPSTLKNPFYRIREGISTVTKFESFPVGWVQNDARGNLLYCKNVRVQLNTVLKGPSFET